MMRTGNLVVSEDLASYSRRRLGAGYLNSVEYPCKAKDGE